MTPLEIQSKVKAAAARVGLDLCRIARPGPIGRGDYLRSWLARGMAGSMNYLYRNLESRLDPGELLPDAKSAIVLALNYKQPAAPPGGERPTIASATSGEHRNGSVPSRGRVAMYAWGEDYHNVMRDKLRSLESLLRTEIQGSFECRICVDTAPIVERELAAAAGLGWIGKNTMVIHPALGSFFYLGVILTTLEIAADQPIEDHCGTCTACLEACPTQAFPAPYQMDASRCISYLTIEHRGDISESFHQMMGDWLFGCDVCQDVCPHNRKAPQTSESRVLVHLPASEVSINEILEWTEEDYRTALRGSAMRRAKCQMLQRNARIVNANRKQE